ncbi:MAG: FAD:protein FMN transferase [Actinobacteria bacterium]|nr:FAD:protein FMN transferase [Actinomycetota bacterium]
MSDSLAQVTARPAPLAVKRSEHVWGTVVDFDVRDFGVRDVSQARIEEAINEAVRWLHRVDGIFSTYRDDSVVTAYRRGQGVEQLKSGFSEADVLEFMSVLAACDQARADTDGAFNPWALPEGFDPSGYVKGWAVARAADILREHGLAFFAINAGGDIVCAGGEDVGVPWHIGIRHPDFAHSVMQAITINTGATATSGTYERGNHIINPHAPGVAVSARAATVVGPDAALCEVWATALIVDGPTALHKVAALGEQWSALTVVGERVTSVGPAFG